jgi:hypothetical protein
MTKAVALVRVHMRANTVSSAVPITGDIPLVDFVWLQRRAIAREPATPMASVTVTQNIQANIVTSAATITTATHHADTAWLPPLARATAFAAQTAIATVISVGPGLTVIHVLPDTGDPIVSSAHPVAVVDLVAPASPKTGLAFATRNTEAPCVQTQTSTKSRSTTPRSTVLWRYRSRALFWRRTLCQQSFSLTDRSSRAAVSPPQVQHQSGVSSTKQFELALRHCVCKGRGISSLVGTWAGPS